MQDEEVSVSARGSVRRKSVQVSPKASPGRLLRDVLCALRERGGSDSHVRMSFGDRGRGNAVSGTATAAQRPKKTRALLCVEYLWKYHRGRKTAMVGVMGK